ncbi:ribosome small subunit-dependent GTPase A [Aerococcaceae bacterium WGS1372]
MEKIQGVIYQSISGFYYVWANNKSYATKPKGLFRHKNKKPLVGDDVIIEVDHNDQQSESRLVEILKRRNELVRPSISNVDYAMVVTSLVEPNFSYNLLDYFLVSVESKHIEPIILLSKFDLLKDSMTEEEANQLVESIRTCYEPAGYQFVILQNDKSDVERIKNLIDQGTYVVMGQSGVGKSTLSNQLLPEIQIETASISESLNRGRHTTREVTLYPFQDSFIADTPGFSAIEFPDIEKEDLRFYFPEIREAGEHCKFRSCVHLNEPACHVKELVEQGEIAQTRYDNYVQIYERIEQRKTVYKRKK